MLPNNDIYEKDSDINLDKLCRSLECCYKRPRVGIYTCVVDSQDTNKIINESDHSLEPNHAYAFTDDIAVSINEYFDSYNKATNSLINACKTFDECTFDYLKKTDVLQRFIKELSTQSDEWLYFTVPIEGIANSKGLLVTLYGHEISSDERGYSFNIAIKYTYEKAKKSTR